MLATVFSGAVYGVDAYPVEIEVNAGHGDPQTIIVGLPDTAVKESKDRVNTAVGNSGFKPSIGRTTVNLAPADRKKEGPLFDLPIAIGMLAASEEIKSECLADYFILGELALSGEVRKCKGVLPIALQARRSAAEGILVPAANAAEAAVVKGLKVYAISTLRQAADFLAGTISLSPEPHNAHICTASADEYMEDYSEVKGQETAKRALEVAVTGGHNVLMIGPPGTGKSMLAKRLRSILPPMNLNEALEATKIHSIAGTLQSGDSLIATRPFRSPHHTISDAGLLGGGAHPAPGEVSLAHNGVLFLDELPEFHRNVLEVMRQPLEDGYVTISRAAAAVTFPCHFMLIAAMNPCPCGYFTDHKRECRCTQKQIQNYRNKISGPLLDRIDLHVEVPAIQYRQLASLQKGEASAQIRERVIAGRRIQYERFKRRRVQCNAAMTARDVEKLAILTPEAGYQLKEAISELNFSARAYNRIIKVSRTIADLDGSDAIEGIHVSEAVQYRTLDRQLW